MDTDQQAPHRIRSFRPSGELFSPMPQKADALLSVRDIGIRFGGIVALDDVSFDIARGQILGLIGPNGAGKTTLFNCITRLYTPQSGDILFEGQSLLREPAHRMPVRGIARTFQNLALFRKMSVIDNVRVGGHVRTRSDFVSDALRLPWITRQRTSLDQQVWSLLESLDLRGVAERPVADLSTGTQKRVELARALAARPKLLLLDEPAAGLNHHEVDELGQLIRRVSDAHDVTILLVEHHMNLVMSVSERVVALDFGRRIAEGAPEEIRENPAVIRAYLGDAN
jgi:branched-chain amino acid transport system ATP-binding protein